MKSAKPERMVVGWREWVALPELGIDRIKAKIDTGARTSALHAFRIAPFRRDGKPHVGFYVHPVQRRRIPEVWCEAEVCDQRRVTSSNGKKEQRYVIKTMLRIGDASWPIEMTLTNRDEMGFRMLLGRQALRRTMVYPHRSHISSKALRKKRKPKRTES